MSDKKLALEHIIKNIAEGKFTPTGEKPMTLAEAIRRTRLKEKQVDDREFNTVNKDQALGYEETEIKEYGDRLNQNPVNFEDGGKKKKLKEAGYDGAGGINPAQGGEFKGNQPGFPRVVPKIAPPVGDQQAGRGALRVGTSTSKQLNKQGVQTANIDTQEEAPVLAQPIPIDKEDIKKLDKKVVKEGIGDTVKKGLGYVDTGAEYVVPYYKAGKELARGEYGKAAGDAAVDTALLAFGGPLVKAGAKALGAAGKGAISAGSKLLGKTAAPKVATGVAGRAATTGAEHGAERIAAADAGKVAVPEPKPVEAPKATVEPPKPAEQPKPVEEPKPTEKSPSLTSRLGAGALGAGLGALAGALGSGGSGATDNRGQIGTTTGSKTSVVRARKVSEETGQDRRKVDNMPRTMKGDGQARRDVQYVDRENEPTSSKSKLARLASYKVNVIDEESSMQSAKDANDSKNNSLDQGPDKNKTNIDTKTKVYNYDGDTEIIINPDLNKNTLDMKEAKKAMMVARFKKIISDK